MLVPLLVPIIPLSCFSLVSRARVFPNPNLALGRPVEEADTKAFVSWGKAFHKLLEIFQKVSRNFSKSCSKVAQRNKNEFWSDAKKNANCTTKVIFLSIFVRFGGVTSVAK